MLRLGIWCALGLAVGAAPAATAEAGDDARAWWSLLDREVIGADAFTRAHPEWDGRGVVIAVLDTGVDPSVAGLTTTPQGGPKVIEARDFSGEGDVELRRASPVVEDGVRLLRDDEGVVRGVDALPSHPAGERYWLGWFREEELRRSSVTDVNRDGDSGDAFAVVAYRPEGTEAPVAIVDTDGDGDLADEVTRRSYRDEPRWFSFGAADPREDQTPVAFTLTVFPDDERRVELHFDDGGHGSHVAGIASGYRIHDRDGFHGIAPGARVLSLKIGDNSLAGGATTAGSMRRAIDYAARWSREQRVPVVINLSYGIGSELEGDADIDHALDRVLAREPLLAAVVAAGNEGPGLSTVGTPGASALAFTTGALLTAKNAEALWGGRIAGPRVFSFSSRGGELDKPDGLAPGVAWSTVPPFLDHSVMAGTSMATPQATGAHALVISAALAAGVPWNGWLLKRVFRDTARPLKGYTALDQGSGAIRVDAAYRALARLDAGADARLLAGWSVTTPVPHRPGQPGASASYWRTGTWVPGYPHVVEFDIAPVLYTQLPESERQAFFATLELRSDARWLDPTRSQLTLRGEGSTSLRVTLDPKAVRAHGVHAATIIATPRGAGSAAPAFRLPVRVVTPHTFRTHQTRSLSRQGRLDPGGIERVLVEVPAGAAALVARLSVPEGRYGSLFLNAHDPEGRPLALADWHASSVEGRAARLTRSGRDLAPGVWELVPYASFRNLQRSDWRLDVTFVGLEVPPALAYSVEEGAGLATSATVVNRFDAPYRGRFEAALRGHLRHREIDIVGPEERLSFGLGPMAGGARLTLRVTAEDYNLFTDIAVNVLDADGKVVTRTGFGSREVVVDFDGPPGDYTLEIIGAVAAAADAEDVGWSVELEELHRHESAIPLTVEGPDSEHVVFYPGVPVDLELHSAAPPPEPPDGFLHAARLSWRDDLARGAPPIPFDVRLE